MTNTETQAQALHFLAQTNGAQIKIRTARPLLRDGLITIEEKWLAHMDAPGASWVPATLTDKGREALA